MAITRHRAIDTVDRTTVSEATRRDAKPVQPPRFETYREERDWWIAQKRRLESELVGYSKAAFSGEQARIRRLYQGETQKASFNAWISRKASMEDRRQALVAQKQRVEEELLRLKPLVKAENQRTVQTHKGGPGRLEDFGMFRDDGSLVWDGVAAQILLELRAIRQLLETKDR